MLSRLGRWVGQFAVGPMAMAAKGLMSPVAFGVTALVTDENGRVGLVQHSYKPGWSLPGGGVARGELPAAAILRELQEEIGLVQGDPPVLIGLYSRPAGWATNVIALYRVTNARAEFRPNLEIREFTFADPAAPPPHTASSTLRRLAELAGAMPPNPIW